MIELFGLVVAQVVNASDAAASSDLQKKLDESAKVALQKSQKQLDAICKRYNYHGKKIRPVKSDEQIRLDSMQRRIDFNTATNMAKSMQQRY
ncbi:MAG: hypothetical protein KGS72_22135 [Cyanobacteria bacterium REEB67]|nr:hypothetical protein [Cyanobacteria bacterium REEB67]